MSQRNSNSNNNRSKTAPKGGKSSAPSANRRTAVDRLLAPETPSHSSTGAALIARAMAFSPANEDVLNIDEVEVINSKKEMCLR